MNAEPKRHRSETESMSQTTRDRLIMEHAPLIKYIVNRIAQRLPSHVDLDDLINTGVIGLMDAIEKYNPEKNCKFKTYAEFRIKGAILDQLRSLDWVPRSVRQKSRKMEAAYSNMEQRLGRAASDEEVADEMGVEIRKFHEMLNQVRGISVVNLDEVRSASDLEKKNLIDVLEDTTGEDPAMALNVEEMKKIVAESIGMLPDKERLVISLYYYDELNMKEIGKILDITESRVCQIHTKAILRLRGKLKSSLDK
ncbi:MAG: FliA/WhiG family RNA polymerase sigma factor [Deltaproteobacteria bacterium]|nr:FliA/WhiG family RNA polymerase sigma factor [Deltaproteobacteria bacterium]